MYNILPPPAPKPVRMREMASVVTDVAEALHRIDRMLVDGKLQVFPDQNLDRRVHVLESAAKLLDLIAGSAELVAAIQEAVKKKKADDAALRLRIEENRKRQGYAA